MIIEIILGVAYYTQGFFNIRRKHDTLFGKHGELLKVYLGSVDELPLEGYVSRTINNNGTPRIMVGVEMTRWIQKHFKKGDILKVHYVSANELVLLEPNNDL